MDIPWSWVAAGAAVGAGAAVVASVASQREFDQKNKARNFRPEHPPECELDGRNRVALAVCGSVAAVRCPAIAQELVSRGFYVDVIMTEAAAFFLQVDYRGAAPGQALLELAKRTDASGTPLVTAWCDDDEWRGYTRVGDSVLHIRLADRNRGLLIAPLDANTLAKLAHGTADNLVSCVARAWCWRMEPDFEDSIAQKHGRQAVQRPVVVAPAMNTFMWHQQPTQHALAVLREAGARVIDPVVKTLACGVRGAGAMAAPADIAAALEEDVTAWAALQGAAEAKGLPPLVRSA